MLLLGGESSNGLTIDQMTVGVSKEGLEQVLAEVKVAMIDDATTNLQNYTSLEETIRQYWQGTDCDQWCDNFVHLVDEIVAALESYYEQIEAEFNKLFTDFEEFQASNVTTGY